jgi:hypothetical protein
LVVFIPVLTLTALAIKLDGRGPIIFRQNRKGFNGQQFVMSKFRTMKVEENGPTVTQATPSDPRVTGIGKLLRSASIDELPQLVNVLRGDMSLIGPRPHARNSESVHLEHLFVTSGTAKSSKIGGFRELGCVDVMHLSALLSAAEAIGGGNGSRQTEFAFTHTCHSALAKQFGTDRIAGNVRRQRPRHTGRNRSEQVVAIVGMPR